jgi:hypothetical protein
MKEVKLKSGVVLGLGDTPFQVSKDLFQAFLRCMDGVDVQSKDQFDFALTAAFLSNPEVERCLWECMKRCLYNGVKINPDTFEPVTAREDFNEVCLEVGMENISPFTKGLFAGLKRLSGMIESSQK